MHDLIRDRGIGAYVLRRPRMGGTQAGYAAIVIGRGTVEEPEIAYEIMPQAHGRGYTTESARAVLDAAFTTGRCRIWAAVRPWNGASLRVLDKLGSFHRDRATEDEHGQILWFCSERTVDQRASMSTQASVAEWCTPRRSTTDHARPPPTSARIRMACA